MFEALLTEARKEQIEVIDLPFRGRIKGLYFNRVIAINKQIDTIAERTCVLAEELGHYHTSSGDLLDQSHLLNRKLECRAQRWGYEKLVPLDKLIAFYNTGIRTSYDLAEALGVTEAFLTGALQHYINKHGPHCRVGEYWIHFQPFRVFECYSK